MPDRPFISGAVDQDAPYRFRRRHKKVGPVLPALPPAAHPDPGLMHQGGGLQCLTRVLLSHLLRGNPPQILVNQRQQLPGGNTAFATQVVEEHGEVVRGLISV